MPEFSIEVRELLTKIVTIEADSSEEAVEKVEEMWGNNEIILSADDYEGKIVQDSDSDDRIYLGFFE